MTKGGKKILGCPQRRLSCGNSSVFICPDYKTSHLCDLCCHFSLMEVNGIMFIVQRALKNDSQIVVFFPTIIIIIIIINFSLGGLNKPQKRIKNFSLFSHYNGMGGGI